MDLRDRLLRATKEHLVAEQAELLARQSWCVPCKKCGGFPHLDTGEYYWGDSCYLFTCCTESRGSSSNLHRARRAWNQDNIIITDTAVEETLKEYIDKSVGPKVEGEL